MTCSRDVTLGLRVNKYRGAVESVLRMRDHDFELKYGTLNGQETWAPKRPVRPAQKPGAVSILAARHVPEHDAVLCG